MRHWAQICRRASVKVKPILHHWSDTVTIDQVWGAIGAYVKNMTNAAIYLHLSTHSRFIFNPCRLHVRSIITSLQNKSSLWVESCLYSCSSLRELRSLRVLQVAFSDPWSIPRQTALRSNASSSSGSINKMWYTRVGQPAKIQCLEADAIEWRPSRAMEEKTVRENKNYWE